MLYKELYKESNELAKERFVLVRERVAEIEEKPETEEKYKEYFRQTAQLLQKQAAVYDLWADDAIQKQSLKEAERCNQALYKDILGEAYQTSYANPDYAVEQLEKSSDSFSVRTLHISDVRLVRHFVGI